MPMFYLVIIPSSFCIYISSTLLLPLQVLTYPSTFTFMTFSVIILVSKITITIQTCMHDLLNSFHAAPIYIRLGFATLQLLSY